MSEPTQQLQPEEVIEERIKNAEETLKGLTPEELKQAEKLAHEQFVAAMRKSTIEHNARIYYEKNKAEADEQKGDDIKQEQELIDISKLTARDKLEILLRSLKAYNFHNADATQFLFETTFTITGLEMRQNNTPFQRQKLIAQRLAQRLRSNVEAFEALITELDAEGWDVE